MAQAHTFPTVSELLPGFRIPFQYLGTGESPAARAIPDTVLLEWILANTSTGTAAQTVSNGGTLTVPAGQLLEVIAIEAAAGARTLKIGTSAGGEQIMELSSIPDGSDFSYTLNRYTSAGLTLHFTLTGGTASVLLFTRSKI